MERARALHELFPMTDASRGQIIVAFKRAARALGLSRPARDLVLYLVSRTKPDDWTPGNLPIAHPSNRDLAEELEIGPTRLKALVREAAEAGLLVCRDSPTGRRWARRQAGPNSPIAVGYGFDLSPLSRRHDEFCRLIAAQEERRREGERLRRDIIVVRNRILELCECAAETGATGTQLDQAAADAAQLAALRGTEIDPGCLGPILGRLEALRDDAERQIALLLPVESDPVGSPKVTPITTTNTPPLADASEAEGPSRPSAINDGSSRSPVSPTAAVEQPGSPLRGFLAPPDLVLRIAPQFRDFCSSSRPTPPQIVDAASFVTHHLGVSPHAWGQACSVMGRYGAAVAVAVIAARSGQGRIRSPGGVLRSMIARHQAGTLHLDRSLYGLLDDLGLRQRA